MVGNVEGLAGEIAAGHEGDGWAATEDVEEGEEDEERGAGQEGGCEWAAFLVVVHGLILADWAGVIDARAEFPRLRVGLVSESLAAGLVFGQAGSLPHGKKSWPGALLAT